MGRGREEEEGGREGAKEGGWREGGIGGRKGREGGSEGGEVGEVGREGRALEREGGR